MGKEVTMEMKEMRKEFRDELHRTRAEVVFRIDRIDRIDSIDSDLAHFYKVTGVLEGRVDELSKR